MLAYILRYILGATCLACHSLRPFVRNMIYGGLYITAFQTATSFSPFSPAAGITAVIIETAVVFRQA